MYVLTVQNTSNNRWVLAADKFQDPSSNQKVQAFTYFENFITAQIEGFQFDFYNREKLVGSSIPGRNMRFKRLKMFVPHENEM